MKWQQERSASTFPCCFAMLQYPVLFRSKTTDLGTVVDSFIRQEYGQLPREFSQRVIVDAGVYTADTSAYFLTVYAEAHVIALEPAPESFRHAARTLSLRDGRIDLLKLHIEGAEREVLSITANGSTGLT